MNMVLIGLRGSGKTKLGKILSLKTGLQRIDIDEEIEKSEGMTISEIVKLHGWKYFREKEKLTVKKISKLKKTIIATGGGTIINPENKKTLSQNNKVIYLHRSPEKCTKWIIKNKKRPSLTNANNILEEMRQLYLERDPIYRKIADIIFYRSTNLEKDAEKIILNYLNSH